MPILESLAIKLAVDCFKWLAGQGINYFTKSDYNDYEKELNNIITNSTDCYKQTYGGVTKSGKTHFCDSNIIILELLKFRLSKNPKTEEVKKAIQSDRRIEAPTEKEMFQFMEIFSENVKKSSKLIELNIANNYKEEIFNISAKIDAVADTISELRREGPADLIEEWSRRLDEVTSNIEKFKPKTAFDILERLEERIAERGITISNALKGRLTYLKAVCLSELHLGEVEKKSSEHFIIAHNLCPENIEYKVNAGLAYLLLGDLTKAENIANEILQKEEYNFGGWAIKLFLKGPDFILILNEMPAHVKVKREFKAQVGYWLAIKGFVRTISELDGLGFNFEVPNETDASAINSKNKSFWTTIINYFINKLYEKYPRLRSSGFDSKIGEDIYFKYVHTLLKKLDAAIHGSEIEDNHLWYKFQLLYMDFILSQDKNSIHTLQTTFDKIKHKQFLEVFQMAQVFNFFNDADHTKKAIKVIENFGEGKNEVLCLLNSYNHFHIKNYVDSIKSFKIYLELHDVIEERIFYNVIQYLSHHQHQNTDSIDEIKATVLTKSFDPPVLKDLYEILTNFSNEPLRTDESLLEKIQTEVDDNNETLRFYVGMAFYRNAKFNQVTKYMGAKVDKSKSSDELKLYCQALLEGEGDKLELLSILENWRKTQPLDYDLIRAELHIREVQRRWDIIVEIAKEALEVFKNDESLIYALFLGYDNLFDTQGIKDYLGLIENKDFKNERFGIAISSVLLRAEITNEAIELLYRTASKKNNKQARSSYIAALVSFPEDVFEEFPSAEMGTYVEYESDGKNDIIFLDSENIKTPLGKALLKKATGESAILGNTTYSGKQIIVLVKKIMNKYLALLKEILKEAENPLSGHSVEMLNFESSDIKSVNKALIENFGAAGSIQKQFREKTFENYYNGTNSFTEVANSIFGRNNFDAYFHLTSPNGKRFMAISQSISINLRLNNESKFILDVTSACLYFQLSKELGLTFKHKFIISSSLRRELLKMMSETKFNPEAKLSLSITNEGVTPYFYQEGFKEGRLKFIEEILQWIDSNCVIEQVDEKINLVLNLESRSQEYDDFLYGHIDNRMLIDRPGHFLLTNDIFYYRHLKAGSDKVISPEIYLEKYQNEKIRECASSMLKNNYVGVRIYLEVLQDEFINMISGKENKFPLCLENFGYSWNPNMQHVKVIAQFLKWLYLSSFIILERKNQTAHTLFLSALRNATPEFSLMLHNEIKKEFSLLTNYHHQIQLILIGALKMINNTNK